MLPQQFTSMLQSLGLTDLAGALTDQPSPVSVRLNPARGVCEFQGASPVPWCPEGIYLAERPQFTLDPRLHAGCYYVQEAASMFHSHVVRSLLPDGCSPLRVLDACAAPGGKTTAVLTALPTGSVVVANEYVPARAAVLRENIIKWGEPGVIVTRGDTASFSPMRHAFDLIVADVPCSGEGMMRKDPDAVAQWSPALIESCAERQRDIVANLWPALRPGGWLIYSTCTFNRTENEDMVEWIVREYGAESVPIPVDESWGISPGIATSAHCCRFIPGRTQSEGLFVVALRKPGTLEHSEPTSRKDKRSKGPRPADIPNDVKRWVTDSDALTFSAITDRIGTFPSAHADLLAQVSKHVDVIHEGIPLATIKGRDIIPTHALALSTRLASGAFPTADLDLPSALQYLRGEAVALPSLPKGYCTVTYEGHKLGFVKNLGNRSNNLYPPTYRIKKSIR
ncbi:MAG: rRNA cytosine-C5-methyltransferase [Muribaculaceae bacterium]|nr:rRNA cytosine-C5-methyltransferase [Muribaculaceae bacterium]